MKPHDTLSRQEAQGRRITLLIALVIGTPTVINMAATLVILGQLSAQQLVHEGALSTGLLILLWNAMPTVFAFLLYRGVTWVRYYYVVFAGIGAVVLFAASFTVDIHLIAWLNRLWAFLYLASWILLWRSVSVKAYLDRRSHARYAIPTIRKD